MPRDIYTADMGNPPSPDEGAPRKRMKKLRRPEPDVYIADMGQPPSPDEGPTQEVTPRPMPRPMPRVAPRADRQFAQGGKVGSASRRADGIAQRGKTKGRII